MTIEQIVQLLGWCTAINFGILILSTLGLVLLGNVATSVHARMFKLKEDEVKRAYLDFLSHYKILVLIFNLAPYLALRIMGV